MRNTNFTRKSNWAVASVLTSVLLGAANIQGAAEQFDVGGKGNIPKLHAASDAGQQAIAKMKPSPGFKVELFAAEPMLANPVALNFDDQGKCYVIETWRIDEGVIDIRGHMDWLVDDLSCKTVEDRIAEVHKHMGSRASAFAQYPDVIRLLEDTSGSGKADKSTVYAEFHDMADGLAAGVLPYKGGLFITNIPHLWYLKDTTGSGHADLKKSLSYGYGIRYNFLGHDLHGPRFGPDGKVYFSEGDRAANIEKSVDGKHVENLESGSVFRCNPDGSDLEIYATGLRNPQSLAFDDYGNLFTGDNNPDYGDPARVVYIVEGGDSGWRVGYQYDHNPVGGGPWMWEKLWITQDKSNATYLLPPIADMGAGPSGIAYYPGTGFPHEYDQHFFECDFRGGFTGSGVHTFKMEPRGAGFKLTDLHNFIWDTLATDIVFGPAGGAYITDWVEGWNPSGVGRIYHVFDPQTQNDPIVAQVKTLLAEGFDKRANDELIKLLAHPDQRIRQRAQFALAERGESVAPLFAEVAQKSDVQLARIHAIWGLGQLATHTPAALSSVEQLLNDKDSEIRAQAARLLGDHQDDKAFASYVKLLEDPSLRVRYFAAMGLSKLNHKAAIAPVLKMLRENEDQDVYLRHAGVMVLTRLNDANALQEAAQSDSRSVRLAALLAMRRLAQPQIAVFLHDPDPQLVLEAARAIDDLPIEPALPQLAAMLDAPALPDFVLLRVINANFRLGTAHAAAALARFAANAQSPERWRAAALKDLADWAHPGALDRVTGLPRPLPDRDPATARSAAGPMLASILQNAPDPVRVAAQTLMKKLALNDSRLLLQQVSDAKLTPQVRAGAVQTLAALNDPKLGQAIDAALRDQDQTVRVAAIEALAKLPDSGKRIESFLEKGTVREQQAALAALGQLPGTLADDVLSQWMDKLLAKQIKPQLELDVLEAAQKRNSDNVHQRIETYTQSLSKTDPLAPYRVALEGGNAESGDQIFHLRSDASCLRCHTVHGSGGIVGPVLDGIGAKQPREYLLESIVLPNAKIAPGFESVIIRKKDGNVVTGIVKRQTDSQIELMDANGQKITIDKSQIDAQRRGQSAMPEGLGQTLSKRDLRDLVEYLANLKK